MSVISKIKQLAKLKRKAYRDAYVEEHVKTSLPFQIRALREQREWSQADLGAKTGMRQNAISRLEKSNYGSLSVNTLIRLASAFDVALMIKFVPFRKLLDEFSDLSTEALEVPSFDNEVPDLEDLAATPTWYQSISASYAIPFALKTHLDLEAITTYQAETFRALELNWESIKHGMTVPVQRFAGYLSGGVPVDVDVLPSDEMPMIDYTEEPDDLSIQTTAIHYQFMPHIRRSRNYAN